MRRKILCYILKLLFVDFFGKFHPLLQLYLYYSKKLFLCLHVVCCNTVSNNTVLMTYLRCHLSSHFLFFFLPSASPIIDLRKKKSFIQLLLSLRKCFMICYDSSNVSQMPSIIVLSFLSKEISIFVKGSAVLKQCSSAAILLITTVISSVFQLQPKFL